MQDEYNNVLMCVVIGQSTPNSIPSGTRLNLNSDVEEFKHEPIAHFWKLL